jgi:hypothetical protein
LLLGISLWLGAESGFGQLKQAEDFFHEGAQDYIFGQKEEAGKAIATGLQYYPGDPQLTAVARLLQKKEQQQQQNQSKQNKDQKQQEQKKDSQDQKDKQNQQQQQQQQAKNDQQKKDEQKKPQEQQAKQGKDKKDKEAQANKSDERDKGKDKGDGSNMMLAQMTPQQARQLLDAQRDDERALIFQPTNVPPPPPNVATKDW